MFGGKCMKIILASKSPRRKELLSLITNNFDIIVSDADEHVDETLTSAEKVKSIAKQKANIVASNIDEDCVVIGSDTIVVVDETILGKPHDHDDAVRMLHMISGRTHKVMTGVSVVIKKEGKQKEINDIDIADVHVNALSDEEIENWINTGNAWDKAGAYAIQQEFAVHIDKINGSFATVMGLPVHLVYNILKDEKVL